MEVITHLFPFPLLLDTSTLPFHCVTDFTILDPLEAFGGIQTLSPKQSASAKFISELAEGGLVGWEKLKRDSNGYHDYFIISPLSCQISSNFILNISIYVDVSPNVNWQVLFNSLNSIAVLEFQGIPLFPLFPLFFPLPPFFGLK
jgi:hypothetical protein